MDVTLYLFEIGGDGGCRSVILPKFQNANFLMFITRARLEWGDPAIGGD